MAEELTITKVMQFAVATEDMGLQAYSKLSEKFSDNQEMSSAFASLAQDEKAHRAQFEGILAKTADGSVGEGDNADYLRAMATSEFFGGDQGLIAKLEKAENLQQALAHVLEFEKATLGYYLAVKDVLGDSVTLDGIINAEKGHVVRLMKYILTDEKMKSLSDPF